MRQIILVTLLGVVLGACAASSGKFSTLEFHNRCFMYSDGGGGGGMMGGSMCGGEQNRICQDYFEMLDQGAANRQDCLKKCRDTYDSMYGPHAVDGCLRVVQYAYEVCGQYCLGNYE